MKNNNWVNLTTEETNLDIVSEIFNTTQNDLIKPALEINTEPLDEDSIKKFMRFKFLYNGLTYEVLKIRGETNSQKEALESFLEETGRVGINTIEREQIIQKARINSNNNVEVVLIVSDEDRVNEFIRLRKMEKLEELNPNYKYTTPIESIKNIYSDIGDKEKINATIFSNEGRLFTFEDVGRIGETSYERVYHETMEEAKEAVMEKCRYSDWDMKREMENKKENDFSQDYYIIQTLGELMNKNRWEKI